ncbi:uncharacterized protein L969DRAFT_96598 [Mixia osmundae IAM 14324]|uniref:HSF-type DNA-binding domain-containing protein n=1 Tax=Mixia osmundae (strain CBS 9802 / IAM 14324 / JCM 22182 / KY 12970) TaxID=764103 RepID=G7EAX2_MIXOS|nr:uncharacterized protein L969DRAFT_96598 [Mixia osmundae IAM 14324]KEI37017.1 hypothetical protein L969DRAFT_96598 [Mixia osmundae IAM 14324]GAA99982.1 hypothetical protein E5Q_06685 [Mixia osmundae IAM 14324]
MAQGLAPRNTSRLSCASTTSHSPKPPTGTRSLNLYRSLPSVATQSTASPTSSLSTERHSYISSAPQAAHKHTLAHKMSMSSSASSPRTPPRYTGYSPIDLEERMLCKQARSDTVVSPESDSHFSLERASAFASPRSVQRRPRHRAGSSGSLLDSPTLDRAAKQRLKRSFGTAGALAPPVALKISTSRQQHAHGETSLAQASLDLDNAIWHLSTNSTLKQDLADSSKLEDVLDSMTSQTVALDMLHTPSTAGRRLSDACMSDSIRTGLLDTPIELNDAFGEGEQDRGFEALMIINGKVPSSGTSAFVYKVYQMLLDTCYEHLICWNEEGNTFVVTCVPEFSKLVLPRHFKHSNFSSFVRQLNMYGWSKTNKTPRGHRGSLELQAWEFAHPDFRRGRIDLLDQIKRKGPESSPSRENTSPSCEEGPSSSITPMPQQTSFFPPTPQSANSSQHASRNTQRHLGNGHPPSMSSQRSETAARKGQLKRSLSTPNTNRNLSTRRGVETSPELLHKTQQKQEWRLKQLQEGYDALYKEIAETRRREAILLDLCGGMHMLLQQQFPGSLPDLLTTLQASNNDSEPDSIPIFVTDTGFRAPPDGYISQAHSSYTGSPANNALDMSRNPSVLSLDPATYSAFSSFGISSANASTCSSPCGLLSPAHSDSLAFLDMTKLSSSPSPLPLQSSSAEERGQYANGLVHPQPTHAISIEHDFDLLAQCP